MKNRPKRIAAFLIVVLLAFVGVCRVWAAEEKPSRPATKKDLLGTWEIKSVRLVRDKKDPAFYPYQRYVFNADSSMKFMTSEKPFTKEWLDKFQKQQPKIDYSVNEKGVLTLTWQKPVRSESALCAYVLKDVSPELIAKLSAPDRKDLPRKGDLTLSFLNSRGRIAYQKVLVKIT